MPTPIEEEIKKRGINMVELKGLYDDINKAAMANKGSVTYTIGKPGGAKRSGELPYWVHTFKTGTSFEQFAKKVAGLRDPGLLAKAWKKIRNLYNVRKAYGRDPSGQ